MHEIQNIRVDGCSCTMIEIIHLNNKIAVKITA
jgi:hypothetical protein